MIPLENITNLVLKKGIHNVNFTPINEKTQSYGILRILYMDVANKLTEQNISATEIYIQATKYWIDLDCYDKAKQVNDILTSGINPAINKARELNLDDLAQFLEQFQ